MPYSAGDRVVYTGGNTPLYTRGEQGICRADQDATRQVLVKFDDRDGDFTIAAADLRAAAAAPAAAAGGGAGFATGDRVTYTGPTTPLYSRGENGTCRADQDATRQVLVKFDDRDGDFTVAAADLRRVPGGGVG